MYFRSCVRSSAANSSGETTRLRGRPLSGGSVQCAFRLYYWCDAITRGPGHTARISGRCVGCAYVCVFVCREREIIRLSLAKGFFDHVAEGLLCCGHMFRPVPCETRTLTDKGTDRACIHIANHPSVLWLFFLWNELKYINLLPSVPFAPGGM